MKNLYLIWWLINFIIESKICFVNSAWSENNFSPFFDKTLLSAINSVKIIPTKSNVVTSPLSVNSNTQSIRAFSSIQPNPTLSSLCKSAILTLPSSITTILRLRFVPSNPCLTIYESLKPMPASPTIRLTSAVPILPSQISVIPPPPQVKTFFVKNYPSEPLLSPKPPPLPFFKAALLPKLKLSSPLNFQQYSLETPSVPKSSITPLTIPNSLIINQPNIKTSISPLSVPLVSAPLPSCPELLPEPSNLIELLPLPCVPNLPPPPPPLSSTKILLPQPAPLPPCSSSSSCFPSLVPPTLVPPTLFTFSMPSLLPCSSSCVSTPVITNPSCNPPLCYKLISQPTPSPYYAPFYGQFRSYLSTKKNSKTEEVESNQKTKSYNKI